jgi:hypothetical protein
MLPIILTNDYLKNMQNSPNYVYENQINCAGEIMKKFKEGVNWVTLIAQPQVGKTGIMTQINHQIYDDDVIKYCCIEGYKLLIINGMSDTELKGQTMERLLTGKKENYTKVYFNCDLQKIIKEKKTINEMKNNKYIIIIDESHYGQDQNSIIDKFLIKLLYSNDNKITDLIEYEKWQNKNVKILSVSATPFSEMENIKKHNLEIAVVKLFPGDGYYGILNFYDDNKILNPFNLRDCDKVKKLFSDNSELFKQNKYFLFRIPNLTRGKDKLNPRQDVKDNLKQLGKIYAKNIKFYNMTIESSNDDIDEHKTTMSIFDTEPISPTIIFIIGMLRAGVTLNTKFIGLVHDNYVKKPSCDVVVQSLLGRCGGYGKNTNVIIYSHLDPIKEYVSFAKSQFKILPSSGKNLTGNKTKPTTGKELYNYDRIANYNIENIYDENEDNFRNVVDDIKIENIKNDIENDKDKRNSKLQEDFRNNLENIYDKKCIITNDDCGYEACHIIPYSECNNFEISNGLLLRADVHGLYDKYNITINPFTSKVEVCEEFKNKSIGKFDGKVVIICKKYEEEILKNLKIMYKRFCDKHNKKYEEMQQSNKLVKKPKHKIPVKEEIEENKPKKPKKKAIVEDDQEEEIEIEEYQWDVSVLNKMKKFKDKNDENKKILTKLRKDNNIDTDTFWNKMKEIRQMDAQKTK